MTRKIYFTLSMLAVFILAACTPTSVAPPPTATVASESAAPAQEDPAPTQEEASTAATEEPAAEEPMAAPTSRGNQLVATDPSTVNLTSGEPQLIEFFAFW